MATAFCCAFNRFQKIVWRFSRALCIPPCIALNTRVGSRVNGVSRKTIERRSITASPRPESAGCKAKPKSGTAWQRSSLESCTRHQRKYDFVESLSLLVARHCAALSHGKRDGYGAALSHRGIRGGFGAQRRAAPGGATARTSGVWRIGARHGGGPRPARREPRARTPQGLGQWPAHAP